MIKIAVVEDEVVYQTQLKSFIEQYEAARNEKLNVTMFSDGEEIIANYKSEFDIIFMDIQMPFIDGMTAAQAIRKVDPEVIIMFITNMKQYAIKGYEVDALDYVVKPISYFSFSQKLARAIDRTERRRSKYIMVMVKGGVKKLDASKIEWIESQGHQLTIHLAQESFTIRMAMKDIEEKLSDMPFYRCNKGYLVNLEYVDGIEDNCAMLGEIALIISKSRKSGFLKALAGYIGEDK